MEKQTLYKIEQDYIELIKQVEEMDGEITEEINEQLEINESQLQNKSIAYLSVIKEKESFTMLIDEEIKRLQALKKKNDNLIKNLKNKLLNAVNLFGTFEIGFTKFGTRKSESVIIEDVNELPNEFKVKKLSIQADKMAIKKALKNGQKVKGCSIQVNNNLKIN